MGRSPLEWMCFFITGGGAAACGAGHADAAARSIEALKFAGDAVITDNDAFCAALA
jgi:hypothetical protein